MDFKEFSKQPIIKRDINFITGKKFKVQEILNYMYSLKIKNLYKISHIDFYESDTLLIVKNLLHLDSHFIPIKV